MSYYTHNINVERILSNDSEDDGAPVSEKAMSNVTKNGKSMVWEANVVDKVDNSVSPKKRMNKLKASVDEITSKLMNRDYARVDNGGETEALNYSQDMVTPSTYELDDVVLIIYLAIDRGINPGVWLGGLDDDENEGINSNETNDNIVSSYSFMERLTSLKMIISTWEVPPLQESMGTYISALETQLIQDLFGLEEGKNILQPPPDKASKDQYKMPFIDVKEFLFFCYERMEDVELKHKAAQVQYEQSLIDKSFDEEEIKASMAELSDLKAKRELMRSQPEELRNTNDESIDLDKSAGHIFLSDTAIVTDTELSHKPYDEEIAFDLDAEEVDLEEPLEYMNNDEKKKSTNSIPIPSSSEKKHESHGSTKKKGDDHRYGHIRKNTPYSNKNTLAKTGATHGHSTTLGSGTRKVSLTSKELNPDFLMNKLGPVSETSTDPSEDSKLILLEDLLRNLVKQSDLYLQVQIRLGFMQPLNASLLGPARTKLLHGAKPRLNSREIQEGFLAGRLSLTDAQVKLVFKLVSNYAKSVIIQEQQDKETAIADAKAKEAQERRRDEEERKKLYGSKYHHRPDGPKRIESPQTKKHHDHHPHIPHSHMHDTVEDSMEGKGFKNMKNLSVNTSVDLSHSLQEDTEQKLLASPRGRSRLGGPRSPASPLAQRNAMSMHEMTLVDGDNQRKIGSTLSTMSIAAMRRMKSRAAKIVYRRALSSKWLREYLKHLKFTKKGTSSRYSYKVTNLGTKPSTTRITLASKKNGIPSKFKNKDFIDGDKELDSDDEKVEGTYIVENILPRALCRGMDGLPHAIPDKELDILIGKYSTSILTATSLEEEISIRVQRWVGNVDASNDFQCRLRVALRQHIKSNPELYAKLKVKANSSEEKKDSNENTDVRRTQAKIIKETLIDDKYAELYTSERLHATITKELFWKYISYCRDDNYNDTCIFEDWLMWRHNHFKDTHTDVQMYVHKTAERLKVLKAKREADALKDAQEAAAEGGDMSMRRVLVGLDQNKNYVGVPPIAEGLSKGMNMLASKSLDTMDIVFGAHQSTDKDKLQRKSLADMKKKAASLQIQLPHALSTSHESAQLNQLKQTQRLIEEAEALLAKQSMDDAATTANVAADPTMLGATNMNMNRPKTAPARYNTAMNAAAVANANKVDEQTAIKLIQEQNYKTWLRQKNSETKNRKEIMLKQANKEARLKKKKEREAKKEFKVWLKLKKAKKFAVKDKNTGAIVAIKDIVSQNTKVKHDKGWNRQDMEEIQKRNPHLKYQEREESNGEDIALSDLANSNGPMSDYALYSMANATNQQEIGTISTDKLKTSNKTKDRKSSSKITAHKTVDLKTGASHQRFVDSSFDDSDISV